MSNDEAPALGRVLSLKEVFAAEHARRDAEKRARDEALRLQQEEDLARAEQLHAILNADPEFLAVRDLELTLRRYTVAIEHHDYRIAAYFEAGRCHVTSADKRTSDGSRAPRSSQYVDTVEDALMVVAQYLADETR